MRIPYPLHRLKFDRQPVGTESSLPDDHAAVIADTGHVIPMHVEI